MADDDIIKEAIRPLKLTPWGDFVNRHGVQTSIEWWREFAKEVEHIADEGGDWQQMIQERIDGLDEFLDRREEEGDPINWGITITEESYEEP